MRLRANEANRLEDRRIREALERLQLRRGDIVRAARGAESASFRYGYVLCNGDPGCWSALRQSVRSTGLEGRVEEETLVSAMLRWAGSHAFVRGQDVLGFGGGTEGE
jgi:hypothetical protein